MLAGADRLRRRLETGLRRLAHCDSVDRDTGTQQRIHTLEHRYPVDRPGQARRCGQFEFVRRRDGRNMLVMRDLAETDDGDPNGHRSEEHTSELQSLMRNSYAVSCLKKTIMHERTDSTK